MSEIITGFCPNCGSKLRYESDNGTVECFACDSLINISDIARTSGAKTTSVALGAALTGFDNPESGVVFIENFFDNYDWESYCNSPELEIPELDEVIGNNKSKNGATPETWYLDFMGRYVPVSKKFEGLANIEKEIVEKFNPTDTTDILELFDTYHAVSDSLFKNKETILKTLNNSVAYAERFKLSPERLNEMKGNIHSLEAKLNSIKTKTVKSKKKDEDYTEVVVNKIEEIPAYRRAKEEFSAKKKAEYFNRGIDADSVYSRACDLYALGETDEALSLFESIRDYSDSAYYIQKINQYFIYNEKGAPKDRIFRFAGRHFIYKLEDYTKETLNVKKVTSRTITKMNKNGQSPVDALSLYEIVDGVPQETPTIRGIDWIITLYGSRLYYFKSFPSGCRKSEKCVACYDFKTGFEQIVDSGKPEQYFNSSKIPYRFEISKYGPSFVITKRFMEDAKGCLGTKKNGVSIVNELNPYTLVIVDMISNTSRVIVNEMLEITQRGDDKLFYTYAYEENKGGCFKGCFGKKAKEAPKSCVMVCDIGKGTISKVLDEDCDIKKVVGDKIIYTRWTPNDLNEELHVYDMERSVDTLIEKNVYDFYGVINDRLYYYIGNEDFRPFVYNNFEGTDRNQIMSNVAKIVKVMGGWFYVQKGNGYNSVLVKVRADGKDAKVLCNSFIDICRFDGNYLYYRAHGYRYPCNLCVVRIDGQGNKVLAENVDTVFPAADGLYYCRVEHVNDTDTNYSLYHMDKNGLNIKKVAFDVDFVQNDQKANYIYFSKDEEIRFKVYKPGKEHKAFYEFFDINKFYRLTKATETDEATDPELILTLGLPKQEEPKGCISKLLYMITPKYIYKEDPIVHSYKTRGLSDEQIMALENGTTPNGKSGCLSSRLPQKNITEIQTGNAKNNGCGKGCGGKGCAPANAKKQASKKRPSKKSGSLGTLIYSVLSVVFFLVAIMSLIGSFSGEMESPAPVNMIYGIGAAILGLMGLGIIPLMRKRPKNATPLLFLATAIIYILLTVGGSGIFDGMFAASGSKSGNAIKVDVGSEHTGTYDFLDGSNGYDDQKTSVWFKFTPENSGTHVISHDASAYYSTIYMTLYDSNLSYMTETSSQSLTYDVYAGNTYYVQIRQGYSIDDVFTFSVKEKPTGATKSQALDMTSYYETYYSHVDDPYDVVWFKFTPNSSENYTFSLSDCDVSYMLELYNSADSLLSSGNTISAQLTSYETYYIKVYFTAFIYDSNFSVNYTIEKPGSSMSSAYFYNDTGSYYVNCDSMMYTVWAKFTPNSSDTYTFYTNDSSYRVELLDAYGNTINSSMSSSNYEYLWGGNDYYLRITSNYSYPVSSHTLYINRVK